MNDITCIVSCMPSISYKSLTIWSSSERLIVKRDGKVLPIGLALVGGMPNIVMLRKVASIACIVLYFFIKNMITITNRRMSHRKADF